MEENINLFMKKKKEECKVKKKNKCISVFLDHVIDNEYIDINKIFLGTELSEGDY